MPLGKKTYTDKAQAIAEADIALSQQTVPMSKYLALESRVKRLEQAMRANVASSMLNSGGGVMDDFQKHMQANPTNRIDADLFLTLPEVTDLVEVVPATD